MSVYWVHDVQLFSFAVNGQQLRRPTSSLLAKAGDVWIFFQVGFLSGEPLVALWEAGMGGGQSGSIVSKRHSSTSPPLLTQEVELCLLDIDHCQAWPFVIEVWHVLLEFKNSWN